ncbi:hypothetical protein AAMO2058_001336900 [Amorphochlora amoebiformis]
MAVIRLLGLLLVVSGPVRGINLQKTEKISINTIDVGVEGIKDKFEDTATFGFASECELNIAERYCNETADAPEPFCLDGLQTTCRRLQSKCSGFEIDRCSDDIECCQCAFIDCPLGESACRRIANECFHADFVALKLEENVLRTLRALFNEFDKDEDGLLDYSETVDLVARAEANKTMTQTLGSRRSKREGKIVINKQNIEKTIIKTLGQADFSEMCVTVSENPSKGVSLGTFLKIYAARHGWFYQHIHRLVHSEQYAVKRKQGCSMSAKTKEKIDRKLATEVMKTGRKVLQPSSHSVLAEDPCDATDTLKETEKVKGSKTKSEKSKLNVRVGHKVDVPVKIITSDAKNSSEFEKTSQKKTAEEIRERPLEL